MEISYILLGISCYALAPYIYEIALSLFFGWQYAKYAKKNEEERNR